MPRRVRVVLCSHAETSVAHCPIHDQRSVVAGGVPVVDAVRDGFGTEIVVLRLAHYERTPSTVEP